ncbi:MAG: 4Fe-4S dicluster domain-containing protein [Clostridia bacterium]|nr:4Fe-4S dicluster domain-containing protein [Clostridia bacterium]MBR7159529.1 4Fe-4S dicluster domain-containing protein [Clostridia bacterium]
MEDKYLLSDVKRYSGTDTSACMRCGKCSGRCPAYNDMDIKPHQFVTLIERGDIEKLMQSKSIWTCLSCMACVERCPRNVAPAQVIEAVRDAVVRQQYANKIKAEDIPAKIDETIPQQLLVSAFRKYNK